ncbi:MAG: transglycosylase [Hyphomicrobiaceae bacterium]|nr:MAG: transglycosylase [Hyphomicrobiaceae bacterium]
MSAAIVYKPLTFAELPAWNEDDHAAAFKAFRKSCERVLASARERTASDKVPPPPAALVRACTAAGQLPAHASKDAAKTFFEENFTPNALSHKGPKGLFTGYYEPLIHGSRTPQGQFKTPVYRRPPDLVNLVDETQRGTVGASLTHARKTDKGVEPFFTRAQIEQGALKGKNLELLYFADPVDVFFMQIQGSGRVKLTDGTVIRVHYDGKNGHPYTSIGRYLIEKGLLAADKVSMGALAKWLKADPERAKKVMWQNASYVFFRELKGTEATGPLGAMNAVLTPGRSLAVDPSHHTLGIPIYLSAAGMTHVNRAGGAFNRLMIAQDVGSAIKGPERGDIYFGSGDAAGRLAGVTKHAGQFFVLLPNEAPLRAQAAQTKVTPKKTPQ